MFKFINLFIALMLGLFSFSAQSAQDPMRPPSWMTKSSTPVVSSSKALALQQILISENRRLAVINEAVVREGETVAGARVLKITKQWVRVKRQGRILTLRMSPTTKEYRREK